MSTRLKALLLAYACEPYRGSEPGIGWHTAVEVARHHEVWVVTAMKHRPAIEVYLADSPMPSAHFVYVDPVISLERVIARRSFLVQLHYYVWQIAATRAVARLRRRIHFDVAHHVSYVRCWSPTAAAAAGAPLVWGPVAGAEPAPFRLQRTFGLRGAVADLLRTAVINAGRLDPMVRLTARRTALAFAASTDTESYLRGIGVREVEVLSPTLAPVDALAAEPADQLPRADGQGLRLVSIGRLVAWKGLHLAIAALAASGLKDARYDIVGVGPDQERLERVARRAGVADQVRFHDISRDEMFALLHGADALLHPALHDPWPTVILEAMAAGKPVVNLDMGDGLVTDSVGIPVPPTSPAATVVALAAALRRLADDPQLRAKLGSNAAVRVREELNWAVRGDVYRDTYARVAAAGLAHQKYA